MRGIADLRAVPGVPETRISDEIYASLPASAPPAPWDCRCEAIVWVARAPKAVADVQPHVPGRNTVVIGGLVRYLDTPVGPYNEVFGNVGVLQGRSFVTTVPFMAVDSRESLVGGRQNWSLPKTMASFAGAPLDGRMSASGDGWTVRVSARPGGPAVPIRTKGQVAQHWPGGALRAAGLEARGRVRPALVTVEVHSDGDLPAWLRPGLHLGAVVQTARFALSEAR